jgi:hypothetical protein
MRARCDMRARARGAQLLLATVACLWAPGAGQGADGADGADGAPAQGECRSPDRIAVRAVLAPAPVCGAALSRCPARVALPKTRASRGASLGREGVAMRLRVETHTGLCRLRGAAPRLRRSTRRCCTRDAGTVGRSATRWCSRSWMRR